MSNTQRVVEAGWSPAPAAPRSPRCSDNVNVERTAQSSPTQSSLSPFKTYETCIIFDWDDTLFASTFVDRRKLMQYRDYNLLNEELKTMFSDLARSVYKCLSSASRHGMVIIITNAQTGWVELCVTRFMPSLKPLIDRIKIVSARSSFEHLFPGDPLCWKGAAFAHELRHIQETEGVTLKNVISFGDSLEERTAVRIASQQIESRAKSIKFLDCPCPKQLVQQLQVVKNCVEWIAKHDGDLDIVLTVDDQGNKGSEMRRHARGA